MQRFVNLKVGSVFGSLHPETAVLVSVYGFPNYFFYFFYLKKKN